MGGGSMGWGKNVGKLSGTVGGGVIGGGVKLSG
ncbi:hypothetical protein BCL52_1046 [Salisediminibacterium halotolerans]|nr:hypothetical protein BCL39_1048 [Actinophytocola xinjiangensis]RPE89385.1 hypothetical protein EDD67_0161 [Salisediminibacterium halotolerans]TWG36145.1 hypothetical protein BCL52_1046 [Salisediminibacterium halotolerans]